jgi:hypothetical protein
MNDCPSTFQAMRCLFASLSPVIYKASLRLTSTIYDAIYISTEILISSFIFFAFYCCSSITFYAYVLPYIPQHEARGVQFVPCLTIFFFSLLSPTSPSLSLSSLSIFSLYLLSLSSLSICISFTDWRLTWGPTVYRLALDFWFGILDKVRAFGEDLVCACNADTAWDVLYIEKSR